MARVLSAIELLLLTAWGGAAWFAGLIFAPRLFEALPAAQAGTIAGMMFTAVFWISIPAIAFSLYRVVDGRAVRNWRVDATLLFIAGIFSLTMELALHPWIAAMREGALPRDPWFGPAHGASSILFLLNCVIAGVLLVRRAGMDRSTR